MYYLLNDADGGFGHLTHMYKDEPPTISFRKQKHNIQSENGNVTIVLDFKVTIDEYPRVNLYEEELRESIRKKGLKRRRVTSCQGWWASRNGPIALYAA